MRKIISLAIAFVMALSLAITVCAAPYISMDSHDYLLNSFANTNGTETHVNPSGGLCSNTYRRIVHLNSQRGVVMSGHQISDGSYCTIYQVEHLHDVYCSSCGAQFFSVYKYCYITHTICPISMITCY